MTTLAEIPDVIQDLEATRSRVRSRGPSPPQRPPSQRASAERRALAAGLSLRDPATLGSAIPP